MLSWAEEIMGEVHLGDERRRVRLLNLMEDWCRQPGASIPQATGSWAGSMGAYRFFNNAAVDHDCLVEAMAAVTAGRCREEKRVVVIQDTTSLDYTCHPHPTGPFKGRYFESERVGKAW